MFMMFKRIGAAGLVLAVGALAWTTPVNVGPAVNTSADDNSPAIGAFGGGTYLVFTSGRSGGYGSWDLYASLASGAPPYTFGSAFNIGAPINTVYAECEPHIYQSINPLLYFSSDRPGTNGDHDIWVSEYYGAWFTPSNLGSPPNSSARESQPAVIASPTRLYFSSNRPGGYGGYDIWVSTYSGGWQAPVNLGPGVNTAANEYGPTVTADGLKMYFGSDRAGGYGDYDIYVATYTGGSWGNVQNLGLPVNSAAMDAHPFVTGDGQFLYFASNRAGGYGGWDIWYSINQSDVAPASLGRVKTLFR